MLRSMRPQRYSLLHNPTNFLPIDLLKHRQVAVMGPLSNNSLVMLGNYAGLPPFITSAWDGVQQYCHGSTCRSTLLPVLSSVTDNSIAQFDAACQLASDADVTLLFVGNDQSVEAEDKDRTSISLPGIQDLLIHRVSSCAAAKKRQVVVVVFSGGSIDYAPMLSESAVAGVLWAGYPGQSGGQAIADILFGVVSPSGRLPHTVYPASYASQVSMVDMEMAANATKGSPGRTYRYYTDKPIFPFGHGLSYTSFKLQVISDVNPYDAQIRVQSHAEQELAEGKMLLHDIHIGAMVVNVTNTGGRASAVSLLLIVKPDPPGPLVGGTLSDFVKIYLEPKEWRVVRLGIQAHAVAFYDPDSPSPNKMTLRRGNYDYIVVGNDLQGHLVIRLNSHVFFSIGVFNRFVSSSRALAGSSVDRKGGISSILQILLFFPILRSYRAVLPGFLLLLFYHGFFALHNFPLVSFVCCGVFGVWFCVFSGGRRDPCLDSASVMRLLPRISASLFHFVFSFISFFQIIQKIKKRI